MTAYSLEQSFITVGYDFTLRMAARAHQRIVHLQGFMRIMCALSALESANGNPSRTGPQAARQSHHE